MVSESVKPKKLTHLPPWLWWLKTIVFTLLLAYAICLLGSVLVARVVNAFFVHDLPIVFTWVLWQISGLVLFAFMFRKLEKEPLQPVPDWYRITSLIVVMIYSLQLPFIQLAFPGLHGLIPLAILVLFFFLSNPLE
ncbi:MAG: hypothetical protein JW724_01215 [Candidatus Altiarchaeota archaeon]|nr:hypothetical protein [Candidatus Altiarchaeota archaeon]